MNAAFSIGSGGLSQTPAHPAPCRAPSQGVLHAIPDPHHQARASPLADRARRRRRTHARHRQAQTPASAPAATAPASPHLTIRDIYDRMEAAGYRDIREIEYSHGRYEVEAHNAQGQRVKLHVNAQTGAVERTRTRD